jgi:hypothetical protein
MERHEIVAWFEHQLVLEVERFTPTDGAPLRSDYAEEWWLSTVARPTALWALCRLVDWAGVPGQPTTVPLEVLAGAVGVKPSAGLNSPIVVPSIPAHLANRVAPEVSATFVLRPGLN